MFLEVFADLGHAQFPRAGLRGVVGSRFGLECGAEFLRRSDGVEGGVKGFDTDHLAEVEEVLLLLRRDLFGSDGRVYGGCDL